MSDTISRRGLIKHLGVATCLGAATGLALSLRVTRASADTSPGAAPAHLSPSDPAAVKVSYIEEAGQLDRKAHPGYVAGSVCDNCLLLQGKPGNSYRPCTLFPGKLVKISGWCSSWTAEM